MNADILRFLNEDGRILQLPKRQKAKFAVLQYLAAKFADNATYSEKEVNRIIEEWHTFGDYFLLRRELVDNKLISRTRDGSKYWVTESGENAGQESGAN